MADALDVVLPSLSAEIVPHSTAPSLRQLARALPPVHRGTLECRLSANADQVDLSQCVVAEDGQPAIVAEWVSAMASAVDRPVHPAWGHLDDFCAQWTDPLSPLHAGVRNIWLEFDSSDALPPTLCPSLFFGLQREASPSEAYEVVAEVLGVLLGDAELAKLKGSLRRCADACLDVASVNQVGVMLSRQTDALRLCVPGLAPGQILPYLRQVGWPGPENELEHLIAELVPSVGPPRMVDIDVDARVHPQVGLEYRFEDQTRDEAQWTALVDHLVGRALCTPEKRQALLAWPGSNGPHNSSAPWPGHLIVESLSQPPDRFSMFLRRLSHVKIVHQPGHPLAAKAYLQFSHTWYPSAGRPAAKDRP